MIEVCVLLQGDRVCMPVDLTVFDDPGQGDVPEPPGDAPGPVERTGAPRVRTRLAQGAIPDAWPRDEAIAGELVKGNERVPCQLMVQAADGVDDGEGLELILMGEDVFRAVLGRAP